MELNTENITFRAIKDFTDVLWNKFGSKDYSKSYPIDLYHRLINKVTEGGLSGGVDRYISGFKLFFNEYGDYLSSTENLSNIPNGTQIKYSDRVYIEINKFIYKSTGQEKEIIRQHLTIINAAINPTEKSLSICKKNVTPSGKVNVEEVLNQMGLSIHEKEGEFVAKIIEKVSASMEGSDAKDPSTIITGLLTSGVLTDMIGGITGGAGMDLSKLLGCLQRALTLITSTMTKDETDASVRLDVKSLTDFTNTVVGMTRVEEIEECEDRNYSK